MDNRADRAEDSLELIREDLAARLRARSADVEEAILARVCAVAGPVDADPEYMVGLRAAVHEVLAYALGGIESGEDWPASVPAAATDQARRAARSGVGLDTVLRRYAAGDRLVRETILEEASRFPSEPVRCVLHGLELKVDRLMAAISAEYADELELSGRSPSRGVAVRVEEVVRQLLRAERTPRALELASLDYDLHAWWHLGAVASGAAVEEALARLRGRLGCAVLAVPCEDESAWVWLGGSRRLEISAVESLLTEDAGWPRGVSLALGEPRRGLNGWRQTHQEAQAAHLVALHTPQRLTRCADVPLEAALLRAGVLADLLVETQLSPLDDLRIGGEAVRATLRAYFASEYNVSVAAESLGVDRRTVWYRLSKVAEQLGCPIKARHAELEIALRLEQLQQSEPVVGTV